MRPQKWRELKPVKEPRKEQDIIEAELKARFRELLYYPLLRIMDAPKTTIKNARSPLLDAIARGEVSFYRGRFVGKFDSKVSKELRAMGAKFERETSSYAIPSEQLPRDIQLGIMASFRTFEAKVQKIEKALAEMKPAKIAELFDLRALFAKTIWRVDESLQTTLKGISIIPKLTDDQVNQVSSEWQNNMELDVKGWLESEIKEMRAKVLKSTIAGNRFDAMKKTIKRSYGVSARKAAFLARQETNLLVTKLKEVRYRQAGVNEYKWKCVHMPHDKTPDQHTPGNVRYSHGLLDGKVFRFDQPPVTSNPGQPLRRNNPGADYNCRCYAIPLVKFEGSK